MLSCFTSFWLILRSEASQFVVVGCMLVVAFLRIRTSAAVVRARVAMRMEVILIDFLAVLQFTLATFAVGGLFREFSNFEEGCDELCVG